MSWQDDPVAGGWQSDPVVSQTAAPATPGIVDRIAHSDMGQFLLHPIDSGMQAGREIAQDPARFGQQLLDSTKAAGRGTFDAAIALPGMAADASIGAYNLLTGSHEPTATGVVNDRLNQALGESTGGNSVIRAAVGLMLGSKMPVPGVEEAPATAAPSRLTPAQEQAAASGKELGMRLTPGQESGSVPLQQMEASLQAHPWTSAPFAKIKDTNQVALNQTWARAIGENSDHVDSTVLGRAADRLGEVFESVGDPNSIRIVDPQHTTDTLAKIDQDFSGLLPNNASITSNPLVQQFKDLSDSGALTGEQLQQLSSKLGKSAAKQMITPAGDRDMGQALYQVKNAVDDLIQDGLGKVDQSIFSQARSQYRNLMLLTRRASSVNPSSGNINVRSLASTLQSADRRGFLFGKNTSEAYDAVRFGQAFPSIVGDSGTATRMGSPLGALVTAPVGIPANIMARAYLSGAGQRLANGYTDLSRKSIPPELINALALSLSRQSDGP